MRQALELALEALKKGDYALVNAICEELKQAQPEQEPVTKYCCHLCFNKSGQLFLDRMIVCPECGNKRCPKATHHELLCTNSNESNQAGSVYTTPPQRTWVGLTDEEVEEIERWVEFKEEGSGRIPMGKLVSYISEKLRNKNT